MSGPTLRFTASNWDTEQAVTVRGVNDGDSDDETVTVTNTASGGEYAGVTASVWLFVDDDDTRGITLHARGPDHPRGRHRHVRR